MGVPMKHRYCQRHGLNEIRKRWDMNLPGNGGMMSDVDSVVPVLYLRPG